MSTNADKILADALEVKLTMDDIIRDSVTFERTSGPFSVKDYWNGSYYEDEDGYAISEAEAQENTDNSNRVWAKYHGR